MNRERRLTRQERQQLALAWRNIEESPGDLIKAAIEIGDPAVPWLIKRLSDGNPMRRRALMSALLQMTPDEAFLHLKLREEFRKMMTPKQERLAIGAIQLLSHIKKFWAQIELLELLYNSNERVAGKAAIALAQAQGGKVSETIAHELEKRLRYRRERDTVTALAGMGLGCIFVPVGFILAGFVISALFNLINDFSFEVLIQAALCGALIPGIYYLVQSLYASVVHPVTYGESFYRDALEALSLCGDPNQIGTAALCLRDRDLWEHAAQCISRLLAKWDGKTPIDLARQHIEALNQFLLYRMDAVNVRLIRLYSLSGGETALRGLIKFVNDQGQPMELRESAAQAIEAIRSRLVLQKERQTLLRAAERTDDTDLLLRSAEVSQTIPDEQLLRRNEE